MRLIFTTRQFQQLHHLDLAQRQQVIQRATMRLTPPERFALNILKLLVYVRICLTGQATRATIQCPLGRPDFALHSTGHSANAMGNGRKILATS
ncbi:DUF6170 family protein [Pseudobowmanella zhangzhouensis]|uniref:DUF6170 family protein n=1 Tax=Pseudobowmanella zhangzhouensis TaxID=1537679 RepID=UPI0036159555